ncbi:MAG: 2-succinyl-5-enolpyruvyl-6-hydroxy-3-cyclohexene-1-carboxylic-acid synthase [Candidatus Marinimicrobia bacterium]|nr:2-succinyl-5-enolpyruvyl-6-hydroxy-3-cyclohexene-1-carboxylic-acid synthase [Candidatus Neomarinimicrobiota bacterium]
MSERANLNYSWSCRIVSQLYNFGVRTVCISPGSRSTPLTLAFLEHGKFECISHVDERSGAFFALGVSLKTQNPVAILSTSGTATANFLPAIIEASQSRIPLIVLTADRPSNLVGTGANQTIVQKDIYGYYVRNSKDLGLPTSEFTNLDSSISTALKLATGINWNNELVSPQGPVHLNIPFEEPLYSSSRIKENIEIEATNQFPSSVVVEPQIEISDSNFPLIVCGRLPVGFDATAIFALSSYLNAPIFADPLSQLRYGSGHPNLVSGYDHFFKLQNISPDLVIRIGQKPISKILCEKLDQWNEFTILIDSCGRFNDDCSLVLSEKIEMAVDFIKSKVTPSDVDWRNEIINIDSQINKFILENHLDNWFEGVIAKICFNTLDDGDSFFIGNSMPIRDVDMFVPASEKNIHTFSNRGASGIDGIISSALGVASKSDGHILLLIGDLSFYHDMNGLLAASRYNINLTIVVVNNSGGGIFSFLPISNEKGKEFDEFWSTTHNLDFSHTAKLYNCNYTKVDSIESLNNALSKNKNSEGINIIEAITDITENVAQHGAIKTALSKINQS